MSLTRKILADRFLWKFVILLLAAASAALGLAGPIFQKTFIDSLAHNQSTWTGAEAWQSFIPLLWFFLCFSTSIALQLLAFYLGSREATRVQQELGHSLYTQMLSLKSDRLQGTQVGEVVSLYTTEAAGAATLIDLVWTSGTVTLFPLFLAPFMLKELLDIPVLPLIVTMTLSLVIMFFLSWRQSRFFHTFKQLAAERTGLVNEWIQNVRALRALGWMTAFERKIFKKRIEETDNRLAMVANGQTMAAMGASIGFLLNLAGIYALVHLRPAGAVLTPGEITAMFWALGVYLAKPLRGIPWILTFGLDAYTSIRRIEKFLVLKSDRLNVLDLPKQTEPPQPPLLDIRDLNLKLGGKEVLKHISLCVPKPELIAIVGSVGSGKTLFVQSLLGEAPASFGVYTINGKSVAKMSEEELLRQYSLVPQDGFIASTSIQNNILMEYERRDQVAGSKPGVFRSLAGARLDLEGEGFTDRESTIIGERGINLSGGQRQRLGIARALYADRPILILDDALSAVDVNTERAMIDSLFRDQLKDRLVLLITHRHLTLPLTDRVLFFKNGRLYADGKFEELLATSTEFHHFIHEEQKKETTPDELH